MVRNSAYSEKQRLKRACARVPGVKNMRTVPVFFLEGLVQRDRGRLARTRRRLDEQARSSAVVARFTWKRRGPEIREIRLNAWFIFIINLIRKINKIISLILFLNNALS